MNFNQLLVVKHVILCCVCVFGDKLVESIQKPALVRACLDNATHAFIGCIVAEIVLYSFKHQFSRHEYFWLLFVATIISSCIDLDHFIEAKSFRLQDATNLVRRPFLHNSMICVVCFILFMLTLGAGSKQSQLLIAMAFIAFSTHHLRDATRRGIWMKSPFQDSNSPAVPYVLYIAYVNIIPHVCIYLLQTTFVTVPKMKLVEQV